MSVQEICIECGVVFWISDEVYEKLRETHNTFYCPSGHTQCYTIKSSKELLQEAKDRYYRLYQEERTKRQCGERRISALQGVITRMKKVIPWAEMESKAIKAALKEMKGHRVKAAGLLGISIRTIFRKIKEYNI